MDVVVSRCAGIDIGKAEVVVCLRVPGSRGKRVSEVRTFSTVAPGDKVASGVAGRTPGEAWGDGDDRPLLETVLGLRGRACFWADLVNARHVKMVPGRKTDVA